MNPRFKLQSGRFALCWAFPLVFAFAGDAQQAPGRSQQADTAYNAGVAALTHQDLATAQKQFELAVRLTPALERGHSALGLVLLRSGHPSDAIIELQAALAIKNSDSAALENLGVAYLQTGEPAKAVSCFATFEADARTQKRPVPVSVLSNEARALAASGELQQAAAKLTMALRNDPRNAVLHDDLGSIDARQRQWPEAQKEFAAAVASNPTMANAHLHLALAMQAQQQPGALNEFARASALAPKDPVIAVEYGKALASAGDDASAIPVLQRVLTEDPQAIEAAYEVALALQRSSRVPESIDLLRQVLSAQPDRVDAMVNLGMALLQTQRAKEALPILQRAAALAPGDVTAHQDLAAAYIQLNQIDDAVVEFREALTLAPDRAQLHYDLGLAFKMQDDATDAIPELEAAERLDPQQGEAPYALGMLYMQGGRYEEAARELKDSLALRPANGDGWATLGSVYNRLDRLPEATSALEEAIRQLPHQPDPRLTLASVLVKQNRTSEASEQRRQAALLMRDNMNHQRAEVATNAGTALLKSGDLVAAAAQFTEALSYNSAYNQAHEGLAKVYEAQGKTTEAASERQKAVAAPKAAATEH